MRKITNPLLKINNLVMISSEENTKFERNDFLQSCNLEFKFIFVVLLIITFCITGNAQTITNVEPTRVTAGSVVTVTGTGFYPGLEETMRFSPGGYNITGAGSRVYVNPTTMTFVIGQTDGTNRSQNLRFTPSSGTEVETSFTVDYIGPVQKRHRTGTQSDRINPRVQEIYTDFSSVLTFRDGDLFNTGDDYSPTEIGIWEFFGLEFNANPEGVLVEAGGAGRGMFIGFNDAGNFIARGGDGRTVTAPGCGRIEITPATYNFANKQGSLVVTMDPDPTSPNGGQVTLEFDEFSDGTIDYSASVTATLGYLGYNNGGTQYREWSGGNDGEVGNTAGGSIAGTEITSNYDFNGNIVGMIFTNTEDSTVAWRSNYGTYTNQPSGQVPTNPVLPDTYHDLLGFKLNNIIYSTGANDGLLELFLDDDEIDNLPSTEYVPSTFKAYSTNGVQNTTVSQHHIFVGDLLDGTYNEGKFEFLTSSDPKFDNVRGLSMFDVLYDGQNGLNIGSGINNLNQSTTIQFFSGNGQFGFANDGVPDLLIPNMAEAGGTDVYYFSDEAGNVIGTPLAIEINNSDSQNPPLSHWINDQYRVDLGVSFEIAKPSERIYGTKQERPMRLIALELDDFGINDLQSTDAGYNYFTSIASVFNVNAGAGGTADVPFLAYNGDTFKIKSPVVTERPVPRTVCEADGTAQAVFSVTATVDGGFTGDPDETLNYQWFKFNNIINDGSDYSGTTTNTLTVNSIDSNDLGLYRLKIFNTFGTTIVTVTIEEGGTRVTWNGSEFSYPPGFRSPDDTSPNPLNEQTVVDSDRRIIMTGDLPIGSTEVVEGCSCEIFAGNELTVASGGTLRLFDELNVRQADTIFNPDGVTWSGITPGGKATFENNASLVQIKPVTFNQNKGPILMKRIATNLQNSDYVYWSSPVDKFEIGGIDGNNTFRWNTIQSNTNGTHGNWATVADNHEMEIGVGYIKRVPSGNSQIQTDFFGRPRNGTITMPLMKTPDELPLPIETAAINRNWNLIGNPYPSAISATKFLLENADGSGSTIEGAVHLWTHGTQIGAFSDPYYQNFGDNYNSNDYLTYNLTGASVQNGFAGNIASGQGFFVKARDVSNPEITFTNLMRYNDPSNSGDTDPILNNQFYRMTDVGDDNVAFYEDQKIWLSLVNENNLSSTILVGYVNGATLEKDNLYDARTNGGAFSIYSMIEDEKMVIQGRPLPFEDIDRVPLGVTLNQNGIFNIAINQVEGNILLDEEQDIFLEDTYLNVVHDLRESPYAFTGEAGEQNDRFLLRYTNETLSDSTKEITDTFVFINDGQLRVKSKRQINTVEVFDLTGKRVVRHYAARSMELEKDFNHANGIYLASILFSDGTVLNKKLIN